MNGYGLASWVNLDEYKTHFVTASYMPDEDGCRFIRLNRLDSKLPNGHEVLGRTASPALCKSITTGNYTGDMGIIGTGMEDGTVMLWDIATLYNQGDVTISEQECQALLSSQLVHEGCSVNAIEFNPQIPNLLASGGSEVQIQDIQENIEEPNVFVPGEPNFHEGATITSVSWNKVVPYILASAANNGSVVVWDLKNSKAIFNFKDPNLVSYSYDPFSENTADKVTANYNIVWSLEVPTQFLISNDSDNAPMTMWDLRKAGTPILTLADIHAGGVLSTAWCPHDHKIIASSSNEGRTSFFHSDTGDLLSSIQDGKKYLDLAWSPFNRGLLLGYNTDNETNVLDFTATTSKAEASDSTYAPKWLSRPLGARFGFGGKLVTFTQNPEDGLKLYQTQSSPEICKKLEDLEESKGKLQLIDIIDKFVEQSPNEIERMEWITIRSLCNKNFDSLFALLDIDKEKVFLEAERFSGKKKAKKTTKTDPHKAPKENLSNLDVNQANEFFANLAENSDKRMEEEEKKIETVKTSEIKETVSRNSNWNEGAEGIIKRNLLIGNIEGAAECALKCGRTTEALLLAMSSKKGNILEQIKDEYFAMHKDSFISTVIKNICDGDINVLVKSLIQSNWKEALAYVLSYTEKADIKKLVESIAEELLQKKNDVSSAIICYMISQNITKLAELWRIRCENIAIKNPKHKFAVFTNFAEKITFYRIATNIHDKSDDWDYIIGELAEFLMNEGLSEITMRYLDQNYCKSSKWMKLKERAYYSNEVHFGREFERPKYQHKVHQLPRINPKQSRDPNSYGKRGATKPVIGNKNPNIFQTNEIQDLNAPIQPRANVNQRGKKESNKNANFGYSETHPSLISEKEESKGNVIHANERVEKKHRPTPSNTGSTHIFDPSKAENLPPPPMPHGKSTPGYTGGVTGHSGNYNDQYSTQNMPPSNVYRPPHQAETSQDYSSASFKPQQLYHSDQPVIAATKVKPPTAQKKPQAKIPLQRYAPPPRLQTTDPQPAPISQPRPMPASMPSRGSMPTRGAGGPTRGAPPMTRGGAPAGTMPRGGQAPAPFPSPSALPAASTAPMTGGMPVMAPPPPKVSRRGRPE